MHLSVVPVTPDIATVLSVVPLACHIDLCRQHHTVQVPMEFVLRDNGVYLVAVLTMAAATSSLLQQRRRAQPVKVEANVMCSCALQWVSSRAVKP